VAGAAALALLFLASTGRAEEEATESGFDRAWSIARLYEGDEDTFFQSFDLSGRLQLDVAWVDSGDDDHGEFNVRRFRFGFKTVFLRDFTFHVEGEYNPQGDGSFYKRLTDTYLAWKASDAAKLTAGKHSAGFTLDGMTSSKRLLTIDRSNLTNNIWFTEEYIPGVSVGGGSGEFLYFFGIFTSGEEDPELGDFKGGEFELLTLGYDFAKRAGVDEALLRLNLVANDPEPENGFTNLLERIVSLNFSWERGRWGFRTDFSAGRGDFDQSDLQGFYVMPYYAYTERLELVARYTFLESDEPEGIRFARYERELADGKGDRYDEIYLGFNYYWYGHKLKLQNAVQWVEMRDETDSGGDYSGWGWTTAFRLSW
jgi:phosphate-selective porin OprO/OprP